MTLPPVTEFTDKIVAGFRCIKMLGRGAYGATYLASRGKDVIAIKISPFVPAFQNEVRCLRALVPLQVAPKLYFDHEQDSFTFIGMELLGKDIESMLKDTDELMFNQKIVSKIAYQAFLALEQMHKWGIVHRDVKLANMAISIPDERGVVFVKYMDYGLAWMFKDSEGKEIEDTSNVAFSNSKYCSASVATGHAPTTKDDAIQLTYALLQSAGYDINSKYAMPPAELLQWKEDLFKAPRTCLFGEFEWMAGFVSEVSEIITEEDIYYEDVLDAILASAKDSDPKEPLKLKEVDGKFVLE